MQCILNRIHINLASASPLDPVESEDFRLQQEAAAESMKNYVTETHWPTFGHMRATGNFVHIKKGVSQSGSKSGIWVGGRIDGSHPPEIRSLVKVCLHSVPYTPNIYQTIPWCVYILRPLPKQISQWPRPDCHPETPWIAANFGNFCEKMRKHFKKQNVINIWRRKKLTQINYFCEQ